jgi:hypothetical protein
MNIFKSFLPLLVGGWIVVVSDAAFSPPIHSFVSGTKSNENIPFSYVSSDNDKLWRTQTIIAMSGTDETDGFMDDNPDPDLLGVYVDGFPLPKIPSRDDDDELLASIRRVPLQPIDTWQAPGEINYERPLRVIIAGGGLGGLSLASFLIQKGFDVHIFEQARQY